MRLICSGKKVLQTYVRSNFLFLKATPLGEQSLPTLKFTCINFLPNTEKYSSLIATLKNNTSSNTEKENWTQDFNQYKFLLF